MNGERLKEYFITLPVYFPKGHVHGGKQTDFEESFTSYDKIHTIKERYSVWAKRIDNVISGNAVLKVCVVNSSRKIILRTLTNKNCVGYEKLEDVLESPYNNLDLVAKHEGLYLEDYLNWVEIISKKEPAIVIHFTGFRYRK